MRGLYPIIDVASLEARGVDVLAFAQKILELGPPVLQLRAKHSPAHATLSWLRALVPLCRARATLLYANDRPDLALLAGADGVHVGQDDLPIQEVRRFAPQLKIGVSTHNSTQFEAALSLAPDYIALGPVFATHSKSNPDPVLGVEALREAAARAASRDIPLVAIGGITLERAPLIRECHALGAVIAELLPKDGKLDQVTERARQLHMSLGG